MLSDPAARLAVKWIDAHAATQTLCFQQPTLEARMHLDRVQTPDIDHLRQNHRAAIEEENRAAADEQVLLDSLPETPAETLGGIIGKLTMILGECEDNTDATDFPGPHIRSVLDDLKRITGQGLESPEAGTFPLPRSME